MSSRRFSLMPFPGEDRPAVTITGVAGRSAGILSVTCAIRGRLAGVALPEPKAVPGRKDRLWEESCLELFLAAGRSRRYWEINLSPSGDWNVYRFASYRKGMREEPAFASLPFRTRKEKGSIRFSLGLDVGRIVPSGTDLAVGVCAVIASVNGGASHWALSHPGPRPDFHHRDGFGLAVPACGG